MTNRNLMIKLLENIQSRGLLTTFIRELFDYPELDDNNYIYRLIKEDNLVIIDIYDNVSVNRFNRYIFSFDRGEYDVRVTEENNVFVTRIYVLNVINDDSKILKFAHLFTLENDDMISYAKSFLDSRIVKIFSEIINKSIYK